MSNKNGAKRQWLDAKTLEELGQLTSRWIEGKLPFHPFYYSEAVDSETKPLIKTLAQFNQNGLVTTCSQPAELLDEEGSAQRAFVEGYAREEVAKQLAVLGLHTDLLVLIYPPDVIWGYQIPVTLSNFHPFTWCGPSWGQEELESFEEYLSEEAMMSLASAWKVVVIDLQWGRKNYLWEQVHNALTNAPDKPFSAAPSPDLGLDEDFIS